MTRLGSYELMRSLDRGAMGEVFLARCDFLDELREVKIPVGDVISSIFTLYTFYRIVQTLRCGTLARVGLFDYNAL